MSYELLCPMNYEYYFVQTFYFKITHILYVTGLEYEDWMIVLGAIILTAILLIILIICCISRRIAGRGGPSRHALKNNEPDCSETNLNSAQRSTRNTDIKNSVPLNKNSLLLINAIKIGNVVQAEEYIHKSTADIDVINENGSNALHYAAQKGVLILVDLLATRVEKIDARNNCLKTALMYATESGKLEIVNLLLNKNAYEELVDKDNNTMLHFAARSGNLELIKLFVERGKIPINSLNSSNRTAKQIASVIGITENERYLQSTGGY